MKGKLPSWVTSVSPWLFAKKVAVIGVMLGFSLNAQAQVDLKITEIFPGQSGTDLTADWFEIKNQGSSAWVSGVDPDLYYDDESASAADADLIQGITDIQPGESVIVLVTGSTADISTFSSVWGPVIDLTGIEIGFSDGAGLGGGGDEVNIWLGNPMMSNPVDSAAYPNTASNDGESYDVELAAFSTVGNANNAVQTIALGGSSGTVPNIGSPGNQGPVTIDPNAPVLTGDSTTAAPFLLLSVDAGSALCSDLDDPTDPARITGIPLGLSDADTPLGSVVLSATSDNQAVLPDANISFSGTMGNRTVTLNPVGVGFAVVTITATDTDGKTGTYTLNYGVSDASVTPTSSRFHVGASDGSTAIAIDADYMWVGDDEDQTLRLFNRNQSGLPIKSIDFNADLGSTVEIDIEGSFQSGDTIFWMGSHTEPGRSVIFSTQLSGTGANSNLTFLGTYTDLLDDLVAWDTNNGHGLGAGRYGFASGFEIEALSSDPNNPQGAYLGFRGPLVAGKALIVPVTNFKSLVSANPVANSASFGAPIELDLERHSIRSISCGANGCLMVAGPSGTVTDFRLFTWTGNAVDAPEKRAVNLNDVASISSIEGIVDLPSGPFLGSNGDASEVQLLIDTGTFDYYNDGSEAKDLPNIEWKKFRSERVVLDTVQAPALAFAGDIVITEILQNPSAVSDANGEWFEIYNASIAPIDLRGWIILDNDNDSHVIDSASNLTINPGEYITLGNNGDSASNGGVVHAYVYGTNFFLSNSSDELVILAPDSTEIDRVEWDNGATFPDPNGASMSLQANNQNNNQGSNWCTAMTVFGAGDMGTPGMANDCPPPASFDLQITEMWVGQDGTDLTADWFEITNFGQVAWVAGVDSNLYYDDESQDPVVADLINGITDIQPGESVVIVIDNDAAVNVFSTVWSPDYDLNGVEIGWTDGSGLGQGGDGVTLFVGTPDITTIVDYEAVGASPSGLSYDVVTASFSQNGSGVVQIGTNIAVATTATAGSSGTEPAVGSPGNQGPLNALSFDLKITEIFPGQEGDDLTADWFEIKNNGTTSWVSGVDPDLFYDDESFDASAADTVFGIAEIAPGQTAIVLIGTGSDTTDFINVWSQVLDLTEVEIGWADGSGLGGGGDAVGLWVGDPNAGFPTDTASYPDTAPFDGQSYDVELGAFSVVGNANGAVQTLALGGAMMNVPNIGSPGNGLALPANLGLEITEIFPGQAGTDLTEDWFEITNNGTEAWVAGVDSALFYDDESASAGDADLIEGITEIQPGQSVIVIIGTSMDTAAFVDVWSPVIDLTGVQIGWADGAGLGGGGDAVTLWLGNPSTTTPIDTASYPDTAPFDGQSFDADLGAYSVVGNANGAVETLALGGDNADVPNIGSPGNGLAIVQNPGLVITEIFPGQEGDDLTADWFEITNEGTEAWVSGVDSTLYYDDESADAGDATPILGITDIQPGESVIVLVSDDPVADSTDFDSVWSPVIILTDVKIGWADGSGLGGGGDAVTLWLGNPAGTTPIDTASYPDTTPFDGQSYDNDLGEFSVVANANGAVETIALGGDNADVPNIGSPGNKGPVMSLTDLYASLSVKVYPNPTEGMLTIEGQMGDRMDYVKVIDLNGRAIFTQELGKADFAEVDLAFLPTGMYTLHIQAGEKVAIKRISKR
ncbi:MAG: DUF3616 domain-containing protein [Bacteroidota bacterium]